MKGGGIYQIRQLSTNKIYIGSTVNFKSRKSRHKSNLKHNKHINKYLQASYNKYGIKDFKFEILETCLNLSRLYLKEREEYYCEKIDCLCKFHFNLAPIGRLPAQNIKSLKIMGEKVSKALKGRLPENHAKMLENSKRSIEFYDNNKLVKVFTTQIEASIELKVNKSSINNILRGVTKKLKSYPSYNFKFKDGKPANKIKFNSKSAHGKNKKKVKLSFKNGSTFIFNSLLICAKYYNTNYQYIWSAILNRNKKTIFSKNLLKIEYYDE